MMVSFQEKGLVDEIECGNNWGYVLKGDSQLAGTDYKILQNQNGAVFIPCMRMQYNGKTELYYITEGYRTLYAMCLNAEPDRIVNMITNLLGCIASVRENGFLRPQNIDTSRDRIFVNPNTLETRLIYVPIKLKNADDDATFENEIKSGLVKLLNEVVVHTGVNDRTLNLVRDLANASLSLSAVYAKNRGLYNDPPAPVLSDSSKGAPEHIPGPGDLKMVSLDKTRPFESVISAPLTVFGKKRELVDVVIDFNDKISRKHCSIRIQNGRYYIKDEGSANGTYVNDQRIRPNATAEVRKGDRIRMANSDFLLA